MWVREQRSRRILKHLSLNGCLKALSLLPCFSWGLRLKCKAVKLNYLQTDIKWRVGNMSVYVCASHRVRIMATWCLGITDTDKLLQKWTCRVWWHSQKNTHTSTGSGRASLPSSHSFILFFTPSLTPVFPSALHSLLLSLRYSSYKFLLFIRVNVKATQIQKQYKTQQYYKHF